MTSKKQSGFVSLDAEQAALGAALFDNEILDRYEGMLAPADFSDPIHGLIYETMIWLRGQGRLAGPVAVDAALKNSKGYQEANGLKYVESLAANVPSTAGAVDYARIVADFAMRRGMYSIGAEMMRRAEAQGPEDSLIKQADAAEEALAELFDRGGEAAGKTIRTAMAEFMEKLVARDGAEPGYLCGLKDIDEKLGGFRPGKLYIIGGRPGMGKTTAMTKIAANMARDGGVAIWTGEMDADDLPVMMVTDLMRDYRIRLEYLQAEKGIFSQREFQVFQECSKIIGDLPILIDDTPTPTLAHIRRFARRAVRRFKSRGIEMRALIVDYLTLVKKNDRLVGTERIGELTKGLAALARQINAPVIVGSQLSRNVESRENLRPVLSDLRESGDIEQDAFAVILLYREAYYHARREPKKSQVQAHEDWLLEGDRLRVEKPLEWIIAKNRRGPVGAVTTWCEIETGAIRDRDFKTDDPTGEIYGDGFSL